MPPVATTEPREPIVRVVVMGAGGYIGSRLVPALLAAGHDVTATFTRAASADRFWWSDQVDVVEVDVLDRPTVRGAFAGADALYYLVHGLGGDDFATRDREGAYNAAHASVRAGLGRIVYLGGLIPDVPDGDLSPHLRSRLEVEAGADRLRGADLGIARGDGGRQWLDVVRDHAPDERTTSRSRCCRGGCPAGSNRSR